MLKGYSAPRTNLKHPQTLAGPDIEVEYAEHDNGQVLGAWWSQTRAADRGGRPDKRTGHVA